MPFTLVTSELLLDLIITSLIDVNPADIKRVKKSTDVITPIEDNEIVIIGVNTLDLSINTFACTVIDYFAKHNVVMAQLKRFIKGPRNLLIAEKIVSAFSQNPTMDRDYCNNFIRGLVKYATSPIGHIEKMLGVSDSEFKQCEDELVQLGITYTAHVEGAFESLCKDILMDESIEYTLCIGEPVNASNAKVMAIYYRHSDIVLKLYDAIDKTKYDIIVLFRVSREATNTDKANDELHYSLHITVCNPQIDLSNFIKFILTKPHQYIQGGTIISGVCDCSNAKKLLTFL